MFTNDTAELNKYPLNYNMFGDNNNSNSSNSMVMTPGCNSDILPTDLVYPNYNFNHYNQLPTQFSAGPQEMISFTNVRKPSALSSSSRSGLGGAKSLHTTNSNNDTRSYPQHNIVQQQQQQYVLPANDFQGVSTSSPSTAAPSVIVCSQGPGTSAYTPWNIDISSATTSSNAPPTSAQLTSAPFISIPAKSAPSSTTTNTTVAWANDTSGGNNFMQLQQMHQASAGHRSSKQGGRGQLQIMTSIDSGIASMYPHHVLDLSAAAASVASQPSCITSPSQQAAMSTHFQSQPQYQHPSWGMSSSPVESCFNSGSSTPSFASSMSPTSSYSSFEPASSDSSRAASPSHHHHHHHHTSPYDGPASSFDRRHRRRDSESSSSLIIRSRKSSTSSTSSNASQRRTTGLRESTLASAVSSPMPSNSASSTSVSSPTHQCPTCNLCFAGPAVLVRHIESIHDKLLWNCVGCKSNLSRRDAVTRHINLSPMDSVCRAVGTIGQIKMLNGTEIHYEISSYKAKPLDEVMSRMGKKISAALRQEIDRAKAMAEANSNAAAAMAASSAVAAVMPSSQQSVMMVGHEYGGYSEVVSAGYSSSSSSLLELDEELMGHLEDEMECEFDGTHKKRRRLSPNTFVQRKK
ncbi:hypothetical protein BGX23_000662 [Mortierella sp. AD031]|nr:hypothetical protein BGX23_000662 [Mortierella sp. AD031]